MKVGDLVRVRHFGSSYNGKIGIITQVHKAIGFRIDYSVRIPCFNYEIGLSREQCEVLS